MGHREQVLNIKVLAKETTAVAHILQDSNTKTIHIPSILVTAAAPRCYMKEKWRILRLERIPKLILELYGALMVH